MKCIIHTLAGGMIVGLLAAGGCGSGVEPRVIADRVFPADRLAVTFTSFPGQSKGGIVVRRVSAGFGSDDFKLCRVHNVTIEALPGQRIELLPAKDATRIVALSRVLYAQSEYEIATEFQRREVTLPAEGGRVTRWVTVGESVRDVGRLRMSAPEPARGAG
jgi:hypothetical protein